jgi:hypothetical protein
MQTRIKLIGIVPLTLGLLFTAATARAVTPPVIRSTSYNGAHSNVVRYAVQPWMNTNTVLLTVEAWIYCNDLDGNQALVARHFTTNLYFGLADNRLRLYRSGGTAADSDGTILRYRWTHVAATYDGSFARFYINGVIAGTKALGHAGNNCTNRLSLGGQYDVLNLGDVFAGGYPFNGYLDEVRLWSVVRSQSAIAANMNSELRSGTGLLATFGSGGNQNDIRPETGATAGIPVAERWSGFGILPSTLCIPWTRNLLRVDANIDLLNEYRGAETMVLRSTTSASRPDGRAYLMVSTNATNHHLFVGFVSLEQSVSPVPVAQVMCDVNPSSGSLLAVGDWECRLAQDGLQGGQIYGMNPVPSVPRWLSWGQSAANWQAATAVGFEFDQNYEFRIHAEHLNYFTNSVGLLLRYFNYDAGGDQMAAPRNGVTNVLSSFAQANWCAEADSDLRSITIAGVITNVIARSNEGGWTVTLRSGPSALGSAIIRTLPVAADGTFSISGLVPQELPFHLQLELRTGYTVLAPEFTGAGKVPSSITSGNTMLTYTPCSTGPCTMRSVRFRVQPPPGPLAIFSVTPTNVGAPVILRTSPLKVTPTQTITVNGTNLHPGVRVFFMGPGCSVRPPSFCTDDFEEANIVSVSEDRLTLQAEVPQLEGVGTSTRGFQIVIENLGWPGTGGERWNYGPGILVTPPPYPLVHGFEFINRDDGPSVEEFEACYGDSIFNFIRIREPYYAIWAAVYFGWMEGTRGSCYGLAGTSRLMAEGSLPARTFDVPDGDGVHGVRFANGYLGVWPCEDFDTELCPNKPGRWTGFDLFQPFRPKNVWARITSLAGAQTSAEALAFWLSQLQRPVAVGPRRGFAASDPVAVLNRVRTTPGGYTICIQKRDFGDGHCITPYAVVDGMGLAVDALTPIAAASFSLIKVYDNNWPGQERFIEVNRVDNTYRYNSQTRAGTYDGPGLFYVPMSVYRGPRHAPDPFFLGRYGIEFLRLLTTGASAASVTDAAGRRAGWNPTGLTNGYEGALPFVPFGLLLNGTNQFDTTMLFLPATNPPVAGGFYSGGSNILLYGAMGWGDIAYGFHAANTGASNSVDGILIGLSEGLQAMGLRAGAPVTGFGAMVSSRDEQGQSRVFLIDAGAGTLTPDLHIERDGFRSLKIRNRSASPFGFRLNLAGTDRILGGFERAYEFYNQPGQSTLILRLPDDPGTGALSRELDTNNDGAPESVEAVPANGQLRIARESGQLALRWRQAGFGETLEVASKLAPGNWSPAGTPVTTEGPDRVARIEPTKPAAFYRLRGEGTNCLGLSALALGARPNPWETGRFRFEALSAAGAMLPQNAIASRGGRTGLDVIHTMRVHPLDDCEVIHLDVFQTSGYVTFEAVGPLGVVIARQTLTGAGTGPQRVTLRSFRGRIQHVRVVSPNALCLILNVCCERVAMSNAAPFSSCLSFSNAAVGQFASPYTLGDILVSAAPGPVILGPVSGLSGHWLKLAGQVELILTDPIAPCDRVALWLRDFEGVVTATAYDSGGAVVAMAGPPSGNAAPQEMVLSGPGIVRVVLSSTSDKAFLQDICCSRNVAP